MEIKQLFFIDQTQPGFVRGGPFDEMGGMLVGVHAKEVCDMLNEHPTLLTEVSDAQAKEAYALGKLEEALKIEGELRTEYSDLVTAAEDIVRSWQYEKDPNEHKNQDYRRVVWHRIEALERALNAVSGRRDG